MSAFHPPRETNSVAPQHSGKFRNAFRGLKYGVRGQSSFFVHFFFAAVVVAVAAVLGAQIWHWSLLIGCVAVVLAAEMFNTSIEELARAIRREHDPQIGRALDVAAAAVLLTSIGAAIVGGIVFWDLLMKSFWRAV